MPATEESTWHPEVVMIWIDDDVRVAPEWLRGYEAAFAQWPQASLFGGAILPEFEGHPPAWLKRSWHLCDSAFAARRIPPANASILLADNYPPYGANFALRTAAQRRFRYDSRLGARPGTWMMSGEETAVIQAVLASGATGRWVRSAVVHHIMPPERQSVGYIRVLLRRRRPSFGIEMSPQRSPPAPAAGLRDLGRIIWLQVKYRMLRAFSNSERWVPALVAAAVARGKWIGRLRSRGGQLD